MGLVEDYEALMVQAELTQDGLISISANMTKKSSPANLTTLLPSQQWYSMLSLTEGALVLSLWTAATASWPISSDNPLQVMGNLLGYQPTLLRDMTRSCAFVTNLMCFVQDSFPNLLYSLTMEVAGFDDLSIIMFSEW